MLNSVRHWEYLGRGKPRLQHLYMLYLLIVTSVDGAGVSQYTYLGNTGLQASFAGSFHLVIKST